MTRDLQKDINHKLRFTNHELPFPIYLNLRQEKDKTNYQVKHIQTKKNQALGTCKTVSHPKHTKHCPDNDEHGRKHEVNIFYPNCKVIGNG